MPETLTTRVGRVIAGGLHALIDRLSLAEFRTSRGAASAGPAGVFDRLYQRQTGMPATARSTGPQQEAQLKELDDLVRANKIAERLAQIKASKA